MADEVEKVNFLLLMHLLLDILLNVQNLLLNALKMYEAWKVYKI